jgi:mannan endo-1,4-beta-mannosidase
MKKLLTLFTSALLLLACGGNKNKPSEPMADTGRTQRTENLLGSLQRLSAEGKYMFGHHDDTVYGIGWVGDSAHSDVQSVCADLPALLSFDLGRIELGDSANLDRVPFERMRQEIIRHYDRGGVVTLSWHAYNPLSERHAWVAAVGLVDLVDYESTDSADCERILFIEVTNHVILLSRFLVNL